MRRYLSRLSLPFLLALLLFRLFRYCSAYRSATRPIIPLCCPSCHPHRSSLYTPLLFILSLGVLSLRIHSLTVSLRLSTPKRFRRETLCEEKHAVLYMTRFPSLMLMPVGGHGNTSGWPLLAGSLCRAFLPARIINVSHHQRLVSSASATTCAPVIACARCIPSRCLSRCATSLYPLYPAPATSRDRHYLRPRYILRIVIFCGSPYSAHCHLRRTVIARLSASHCQPHKARRSITGMIAHAVYPHPTKRFAYRHITRTDLFPNGTGTTAAVTNAGQYPTLSDTWPSLRRTQHDPYLLARPPQRFPYKHLPRSYTKPAAGAMTRRIRFAPMHRRTQTTAAQASTAQTTATQYNADTRRLRQRRQWRHETNAP